MKITEEQIAELKTTNGTIFQGTISYKNDEREIKTIEFIYKKPCFEDYESVQNDVVKQGSAIANQNLLAGLIVYPEPSKVIPEFSECPIAMDSWITKNIIPFFGGDILEVSSKKL